MNSELIKAWLKRKNSNRLMAIGFAVLFSFIGGVLVIALTFGLTYCVAWLAASGFSSLIDLIFGAKVKVGSVWLLVVSIVFIAMLFVQYLRMDSFNWGRYKQSEFDIDPRLQSDIDQLIPSAQILKHSGNMAKFFADLLVMGPRLLLGCWPRLSELSKIRHMEVDQCASALVFICSKADTVSYEDFCKAGWGVQLNQLRNVEGVNFIQNGLWVSEELKSELKELR